MRRARDLVHTNDRLCQQFIRICGDQVRQRGEILLDIAILLGHSSIRITERHYSPWIRSRQEQLERDVRST
jgi:hypothetical protein